MPIDPSQLRQLTAKVVSAFVGHNSVAVSDLPGLVSSVYATLTRLADPRTAQPPAAEPAAPAVPVRKSVHADFIVCLECGQKLKMLKRHLKADHDVSPEEYRARWNLPPEYPMVAPNYARARSDMAVKMGLGRKAASD